MFLFDYFYNWLILICYFLFFSYWLIKIGFLLFFIDFLFDLISFIYTVFTFYILYFSNNDEFYDYFFIDYCNLL